MADTPTKRRRKPTLYEQVRILARQARDALSGEQFSSYEEIEWDHKHERALGGADSIDNWQAVKSGRGRSHDVKTNGPGNERRITTAGSSKGKVAKVRRLAKKGAMHTARLASKSERVEAGDLLTKSRRGWRKVATEPGSKHTEHLLRMREKAGQ